MRNPPEDVGNNGNGRRNLTRDPFLVLGVASDADDEEIKRRYLAQVRQYSPERDTERFQEIRAAFEQLRDHRSRLRVRLLAPECGALARLKRALVGPAVAGRASRDTVNAVLLEGLTGSIQNRLGTPGS